MGVCRLVEHTLVVYGVKYVEHSFQVSALPFSLTTWEENMVVCGKRYLTALSLKLAGVVPVAAELDLINVLMLSMC